MPIDNVTATNSTITAPKAGSASSTMDKDGFMKLLVAQLKHQDPSNPTDMNGMTAQMTQFGILEQLTNMTKTSEATKSSLERTHAVELLGRTVSYKDAAGAIVEGVVEKVDTTTTSPTITVAGKAGIDPKVLVAVR
jgi:flagellar basal-body rod modification protein FlgD